MTLQIQTTQIPPINEMVGIIQGKIFFNEGLAYKIFKTGNLVLSAMQELQKPFGKDAIISMGLIARQLIEIEFVIAGNELNLFVTNASKDLVINSDIPMLDSMKDIWDKVQCIPMTKDYALLKAIESFMNVCAYRGISVSVCLAAVIYGIEEV